MTASHVSEPFVVPHTTRECASYNDVVVNFMRSRPTITTLCGSTRFQKEYLAAQRELTLRGEIVISVGLFGHLEGLDMDGDTKRLLDELHLRKIELSDGIFVVNVRGYVGESTRREIRHACLLGKQVRYLEMPEENDDTRGI